MNPATEGRRVVRPTDDSGDVQREDVTATEREVCPCGRLASPDGRLWMSIDGSGRVCGVCEAFFAQAQRRIVTRESQSSQNVDCDSTGTIGLCDRIGCGPAHGGDCPDRITTCEKHHYSSMRGVCPLCVDAAGSGAFAELTGWPPKEDNDGR